MGGASAISPQPQGSWNSGATHLATEPCAHTQGRGGGGVRAAGLPGPSRSRRSPAPRLPPPAPRAGGRPSGAAGNWRTSCRFDLRLSWSPRPGSPAGNDTASSPASALTPRGAQSQEGGWEAGPGAPGSTPRAPSCLPTGRLGAGGLRQPACRPPGLRRLGQRPWCRRPPRPAPKPRLGGGGDGPREAPPPPSAERSREANTARASPTAREVGGAAAGRAPPIGQRGGKATIGRALPTGRERWAGR